MATYFKDSLDAHRQKMQDLRDRMADMYKQSTDPYGREVDKYKKLVAAGRVEDENNWAKTKKKQEEAEAKAEEESYAQDVSWGDEAAAGAAAGTAISPGWGTLAGAIVGGLQGEIKGLMRRVQEKQKPEDIAASVAQDLLVPGGITYDPARKRVYASHLPTFDNPSTQKNLANIGAGMTGLTEGWKNEDSTYGEPPPGDPVLMWNKDTGIEDLDNDTSIWTSALKSAQRAGSDLTGSPPPGQRKTNAAQIEELGGNGGDWVERVAAKLEANGIDPGSEEGQRFLEMYSQATPEQQVNLDLMLEAGLRTIPEPPITTY